MQFWLHIFGIFCFIMCQKTLRTRFHHGWFQTWFTFYDNWLPWLRPDQSKCSLSSAHRCWPTIILAHGVLPLVALTGLAHYSIFQHALSWRFLPSSGAAYLLRPFSSCTASVYVGCAHVVASNQYFPPRPMQAVFHFFVPYNQLALVYFSFIYLLLCCDEADPPLSSIPDFYVLWPLQGLFRSWAELALPRLLPLW